MVRGAENRRYTYFILLTAKSQVDDVISGLEAGADDFVTKPFNQYELRVRLRAGERVVDLETQLAAKVEQLSRASRQMRRDLAAAARMQKAMLPPPVGEIHGISFASSYIPCEQVGGDLFNILELDESHLGIYIFDVSGHGVTAALQSIAMGRMLSTYDLHATLILDSSEENRAGSIIPPQEVAGRLNTRFQSASSKGDFITFLYGVLDTNTGTFTYTRAGHPCPIHLTGATLNEISHKGDIPIGIVPDYQFGRNTIELKPADRLYLFTDGIIEASDIRSERFGEGRMIDYLKASATSPLDQTVSGLVKDVLDWQNEAVVNDDMSILAIEYNP